MRIISGKHRGFIFPSHQLKHTRPTTDRAKEALMNILNNRCDWPEISVLDLYSGTGNLAFESWSRGAHQVCAVEAHPKNIAYINQVNTLLNAEVQIIRSKVLPFLKEHQQSYDLIFADPPYASADYLELPKRVKQRGILKPGGSLIIEHDHKMQWAELKGTEQRQYGQSMFTFFTFE